MIAGAAGVLYVWFNGRISPGTVGVGEVIGILVIAVIGGLRHPIGPFIGAALYVFLKTFAIDIVGADIRPFPGWPSGAATAEASFRAENSRCSPFRARCSAIPACW